MAARIVCSQRRRALGPHKGEMTRAGNQREHVGLAVVYSFATELLPLCLIVQSIIETCVSPF